MTPSLELRSHSKRKISNIRRIDFLERYGMYRQIFNMIPQDLVSFK
ncbi:hypothetical protein Goshw_010239 [Gossypium schwendimanii]|uniref:Uncharacterized protein n=1 Tax=Gossypium schwendimanii TaxID=34291 RepID=A0A7J9MN06_GOSSC|nr:hypothetical protein [Gossypium schwendimanii]